MLALIYKTAEVAVHLRTTRNVRRPGSRKVSAMTRGMHGMEVIRRVAVTHPPEAWRERRRAEKSTTAGSTQSHVAMVVEGRCMASRGNDQSRSPHCLRVSLLPLTCASRSRADAPHLCTPFASYAHPLPVCQPSTFNVNPPDLQPLSPAAPADQPSCAFALGTRYQRRSRELIGLQDSLHANHAAVPPAILFSEVNFGFPSYSAYPIVSGPCLHKPRQSAVPHLRRKRNLSNGPGCHEHVTNAASHVRNVTVFNQLALPAQGPPGNAPTQRTPRNAVFSRVISAPSS